MQKASTPSLRAPRAPLSVAGLIHPVLSILLPPLFVLELPSPTLLILVLLSLHAYPAFRRARGFHPKWSQNHAAGACAEVEDSVFSPCAVAILAGPVDVVARAHRLSVLALC